MTDASPQLDRIRAHVAEARTLQARDARMACNEARIATEGLMRLLATTHEVSFGGKRDKPPTLDVMKRALRHGGVLDRRMEDLVSTVQRYGNRAVHFQAEPEQEIGPDEARLAVGALDALLPLATRALGQEHIPVQIEITPEDAPAPTPPPSNDLLRWLAIPAAALVTFGATSATLQWMQPPPRPTPVEVPILSDTDVPATPQEEEPDPATPTIPPDPRIKANLETPDSDPPDQPTSTPTPLETTPLQRAIASARAHVTVDNADLAVLPCDDLTRVRGWLWAEHGYHFRDDLTRAWFTDEGYRDRARSHAQTSGRFTDEDQDNLNALNERMRALGCACPKKLQPRRPCPE